jgi:hypothetical protein
MDTVTFEVEHEYEFPFAVVEDGKVVRDEAGEPVIESEWVCETREYEVEYSVEPAQNGGWDDPSWDAYAFIDGDIRATDGLPFDITPEVEKAAQYAVENIDLDCGGYEPEPDYYDDY